MRKRYEDMTKKELIVQIEGRDAMIDHFERELEVCRRALENCSKKRFK